MSAEMKTDDGPPTTDDSISIVENCRGLSMLSFSIFCVAHLRSTITGNKGFAENHRPQRRFPTHPLDKNTRSDKLPLYA